MLGRQCLAVKRLVSRCQSQLFSRPIW